MTSDGKLKIVCVHPGASMSTHDVWAGLVEALQAHGHTVYDYALDGRIARAGAWLTYNWKKGGKKLTQPTVDDILYKAGEELVARALRVQPDYVLVVSGMYLHPDVLVLLKRAHLRTAILFTESPYDDRPQDRLLPFADIAWTNERTSAETAGIGYVPHAYRPGFHDASKAVPEDIPSHDVVFVGTGFDERIQILSQVDWTGIDLGLYGSWTLVGSRNPIRQYIKGEFVSNEQTTALYRKAKIGLNLYRWSVGFGKGAPRVRVADSMNPRAYELAATGCFTLSEYRPEVEEVFGDLVPTFRTSDELSTAVRLWLNDAEGRRQKAARLPMVVAPHTWAARAAQMEADMMRGACIGAGSADSQTARVVAAGG